MANENNENVGISVIKKMAINGVIMKMAANQ
jgi:hypothetical protein